MAYVRMVDALRRTSVLMSRLTLEQRGRFNNTMRMTTDPDRIFKAWYA